MTVMDICQRDSGNDNMEYVVQINPSEELNLSNFAEYTLMPHDDKELISHGMTDEADSRDPINTVWQEEHGSLQETEISEKSGSSLFTANELSILKELDKIIKGTKSPACDGEGDGPNTPLLTQEEGCRTEEIPKDQQTPQLETLTQENANNEDDNRLIYTNLESVRTSCVNFETPRYGYRYEPMSSLLSSIPVEAPGLSAPRKMMTKAPLLKGYRPRQFCKTPIMPPYVVRPAASTSSGSSTESNSTDYSFSSMSPSSFESKRDSLLEEDTSPDYPKPPNNTPNSAENGGSPSLTRMVPTSRNRLLSQSQLHSRLERLSQYSALDMRAIHNAKERKRRSRIRDACQAMRRLLPGVNERTDNASVFEQFVNYINFLRMQVGEQYEIEYLRESQLLKDKYQTLSFDK